MERGGLIHTILHTLYRAFAERSNVWAVQTNSGWRKRNEGGAEALPLVQFLPENAEEDLKFAEAETRRLLKEASLGHPDVWAAEQEKIVVMVLNFIRYDQENCATENRFPARFEHPFSDLDLQGCVRVRGVIDRVDLIFSDTGELERIRVLDYKGASHVRKNTDEYLAEIHANLNCQLPIYALAAQDYFFGKTDTEAVNAQTETGYLFYQREFDKIGKELKKCLIPLDTKGLIDGFLKTLHKNIQRLKDGDFAVDPLIDSYNDFQSVCRVEAVDRSEFLEII
jgi:RecB family exonuclease